MSNKVRISLKTEKEITLKNNKFVVVDDEVSTESTPISVYINCDELSCWIGSIYSLYDLDSLNATKSLDLLVGPSKLIKVINENCSEYEYDCLMSILEANDFQYSYPDGSIVTAIEPELVY